MSGECKNLSVDYGEATILEQSRFIFQSQFFIFNVRLYANIINVALIKIQFLT